MLKKVAIALVVLLLIGVGVVAYLWNQATALPDWYTQGDSTRYAGDPHDGADPLAPPRWIALDEQGNRIPPAQSVPLPPPFEGAPPPAAVPESTPTPPRAPAPVRRAPTTSPRAQRHELRGFHVRRGKGGKPQRSPAVRASRAVYERGHLEIGVILDLSRLPRDKLKPKDRQRYERAVANFPGITKRDVWVGVEDEPIRVDGYLQLSTEAEVRVGTLTYSLASAAERMGMSQMQLRMEINRELRRLGLTDPEA